MEPIKASMTVQILLRWVLDGGLQQLRVRTILFTDKKYSMVWAQLCLHAVAGMHIVPFVIFHCGDKQCCQ